ncbi:major facilitator superfamily domain-containing protein [Melanogaster broomeanus]|nr:major facilitator superfamily domain-containing protein [Melanogaster broomeanus]
MSIDESPHTVHVPDTESDPPPLPVKYRLYKSRFYGLFGFMILALMTGMPWSWFGPISTSAAEDFAISIDQVNWLGNIVSCIYIPVSLLVPVFCSRFGIRRCVEVGAVTMLISAWVRYAGTATSLSSQSAYALLILGQSISAISQPVFQILGPKYSEKWFDLKGRTTATMAIAIANPIGCALRPGAVSTPRNYTPILMLAILSTAATPALFFVKDAPPSPPTYAGSKPSQTLTSLCRAVLGLAVPPEAYMSRRERADFGIAITLFGILVGATNTISVLSAEWFGPMGYQNTTSGLLGGSLLLSGIVTAIITAPLFDRILTHKLGVTLKILVPIISCGWFSLIWAVRPDNTAGLFAIMVIIGMCSVTALPVGLELGVELTRNADASAALAWCSGNLFGIFLILAEGALRAPATASPPYNMRNALILHGSVVVAFGTLVFFIRARQARRELDEVMAREGVVPSSANEGGVVSSRTTGEIDSVCEKGGESLEMFKKELV